LERERDLLWVIKRPLSTKDKMKTGIFRFFKQISRMWSRGERYKAKRMGERVELWLTPMLILKNGEEKLF